MAQWTSLAWHVGRVEAAAMLFMADVTRGRCHAWTSGYLRGALFAQAEALCSGVAR